MPEDGRVVRGRRTELDWLSRDKWRGEENAKARPWGCGVVWVGGEEGGGGSCVCGLSVHVEESKEGRICGARK